MLVKGGVKKDFKDCFAKVDKRCLNMDKRANKYHQLWSKNTIIVNRIVAEITSR